MKDEIKEILDYLKETDDKDIYGYIKDKILAYEEGVKLLYYITNLQEKSNNQAEEINRLYKQREKFMKKYGYLKEEKDKYKNVIDKIKEYIHHEYFKREQVGIVDKTFYASDMKNILELLEEVE